MCETQKTPEGHEIPVPKRGEFLGNLKKVSKPDPETDDDSTSNDTEEE